MFTFEFIGEGPKVWRAVAKMGGISIWTGTYTEDDAWTDIKRKAVADFGIWLRDRLYHDDRVIHLGDYDDPA